MHVVIVAAHPDDESIGASTVMLATDDVTVIHVTDGAPKDPRWWPTGVRDREAYARERAREATCAMERARVGRVPLGFIDQELDGDLVADALRDAFSVLRPCIVVAHSYEGGHPDHDIVAYAVARAATSAVVEMALYNRFGVGMFVGHAGVPVEVDPRRAELLACYRSQQETLAPFVAMTHERSRRAPTYDFSRPPHDGALHYEQLGMGSWQACFPQRRCRPFARR